MGPTEQLLRQVYANMPPPGNLIPDFILAHGREYTYAPLPKHVKRMTPRMCYKNCHLLAVLKGYIYVEGYGIVRGIPILHAWCVKPGSTVVIDPTTTNCNGYFGIPFTNEYRMKALKEYDGHSAMIDNWQADFPLLKATPEELERIIHKG